MNEFKPVNILVTGGAGFIGCNYVRYMLAIDADVRIVNLDMLTYAGSLDNLKNLPGEVNPPGDILCSKQHSPNGDQVNCETREYPLEEARSGELRSKRVSPGGEGALGCESRHTFVQGDICDRELVERLLREYHIDTIVHFAAESHVDNSISGPEVFVKTNVMGTFTLLEAARQYWLEEAGLAHNSCRFHHISTDEVYGTLSKTDPAFSENTPYAPNSPYSASKAGSDHLVRAYFHTYGLPVTTSNCSNNYGPYQHNEKLIPTIIRSCIKQTPIPVYGDGSNIRDWLYVEDHCAGIDAVIRKGKPGEVYNIGGINEWANIDIVRCICALMDEMSGESGIRNHESLIAFVTDRPGHDWRYAIDATKMGQELAWEPAETFETGIRKTVAWYLDREADG
ncbi:MAG: dTDP-glucose 4,6-dehydratase [Mariprofundus sp.]|nr:dTDP-glucose 4,6-dehydratase [Mariprofundus sp.]